MPLSGSDGATALGGNSKMDENLTYVRIRTLPGLTRKLWALFDSAVYPEGHLDIACGQRSVRSDTV